MNEDRMFRVSIHCNGKGPEYPVHWGITEKELCERDILSYFFNMRKTGADTGIDLVEISAETSEEQRSGDELVYRLNELNQTQQI